MDMNNIKIKLDQLTENTSKEIDTLIEKGERVNWRKYANLEEELLNSHFRDYREMFLNDYSKLEAGRIDNYLSQNYDSVSSSRYSHLESWFINGWVVKNRQLDSGSYTRNVNKTMLKYAEFLTEKLAQLNAA